MYYFGQPVYKYIEYTESTNIDALISKALALYIKDLSLDQTFIVTTDYKSKVLRICRIWFEIPQRLRRL